MNSDYYNILNNMLNEYQTELDEVELQISMNAEFIKQEKAFIQSFINDDPTAVFDKRNDSIEKSKRIDDSQKRIKDLVQVNESLIIKRDLLAKQIERIETVMNLKDYGLSILDAQEMERQRIARDLHDTSLQNLTHLIHKIELSSLYIDKDPANAKIELCLVSKILKDTINQIRNDIFDLRPMAFDDLGLKASIEKLVDDVYRNKSIRVQCDIDDVSCEKKIVLLSIYRIIQEGINNIVKHAEATQVELTCKNFNNIYHIIIKDNGKGFNTRCAYQEKHYGLTLMRERTELLDGNFKIISGENEGTIIDISIPLNY